MKTLRRLACVAMLLALVVPTTAGARVVKFETSAALPDHSENAIDGAFENALDTCVRGAVAMGLTSIWLDRAIVMTDKVVVKMTASDEDTDRRQVKAMDLDRRQATTMDLDQRQAKTMDLMPRILSF
jgi:hypothetical protein